MFLVIALLMSYFWGWIPFGYVYGKWFGYGDIRKQGSGNIGTTNAYRLGGKKLGVLTLITDLAKGVIPILVAKFFSLESIVPWIGLVTVLGHTRFPFFTGGGKGIAPAIGFWLIYEPFMGGLLGIIWCTLIFLTRISSLAGIITSSLMPVLAYFFECSLTVSFLFLCLIYFTHRENILRLLSGEEKKVI